MLATPAIPVPSTTFDPAAAVPEEYDVFCHACGYSLVGLVGDRCPECGRRFDPGELPYARVPWLHRRRIGRVRAYVQTVRQVVRRPQAFADELCRPVRISAGDAKKFRSTSAVLAATSVAAVVFVAMLHNTGPWDWKDKVALSILVPLGWFATVVFLRLATDMPVFIWKGLPSRPPHELAPLHHYASAPLAYAPLAAAVALALPAMADFVNAPEWFHRVCVAAIGAGVCAWLIVCWRAPLALMRAATGCDRKRVRLLAAYLPVHALLMFLMVYMTFVLSIFPITWLLESLERHL